jgi:hypothetical protein
LKLDAYKNTVDYVLPRVNYNNMQTDVGSIYLDLLVLVTQRFTFLTLLFLLIAESSVPCVVLVQAMKEEGVNGWYSFTHS